MLGTATTACSMLNWIRKIAVTVGDTVFEDLKIAFTVKKESSSTPATGEVTLFNLSVDREAQISDDGVSIRIEAGYAGNIAIIFEGFVQRVDRAHDIAAHERKTTIALGAAKVAKANLNGISVFAFDGDRSIREIAKRLITDIGLRVDDSALAVIPDELIHAYSVSGESASALSQLLEPRDLYWYEDDGAVRFNRPGKAEPAGIQYDLNKSTGLVGSPAITERGVKTRSTLLPQIHLGDRVDLKSEVITGIFKVVTVVHSGDNWTGNFFTDIELAELPDE